MRQIAPAVTELYERVRDFADVILVYVIEAHASDEWPISSSRFVPDGTNVDIPQTMTNRARLEAAALFQTKMDFRVPIFVDPAEGPHTNAFERLYSGWPLRLFGLLDGKLDFQPGEDLALVMLPKAAAWLEAAANRQLKAEL